MREDLDGDRRHPLQPAQRPQYDARVVSIHLANITRRTFQCRFRANLRQLFLKVGKIYEYVHVLAVAYRSDEDVE